MSSIIQRASFSPSSIGLPNIVHDAELMGQAYWGDIPDGMEVNTSKVAKAAQARFLASGADMLPLAPQIPDDIIQKAIFGWSDSTGKDYIEETAGLREEIAKANDYDSEEIYKAITAGTGAASTGSTGGGMIHAIADQEVAYLYKRAYPFQAMVPVEANKGKAALWDVIPPYEFGSASFGTEDQSFTESDITAYFQTKYIKYLYSVGRVTKAAQLAGMAAVPARDLLAIRIDAAQDALRSLRERRMLGVTSDVSQTTNDYVDATIKEYPGIYEQITNNVTAPNYVTSAGGTYADIMSDLDLTFNAMVIDGISPTLAICDYRVFGIIRRGLKEYFRVEPIQTFVQGVSKISLVFPNEGGLPLMPHPFLPQAAGKGTIAMIDTRLFSRRSLWQDIYEELAKINLSQKFVISAAETLIDKSDKDGSSSLHGGIINIA